MIVPMVCVAGTITSTATWVTRWPEGSVDRTSSATWVTLSDMWIRGGWLATWEYRRAIRQLQLERRDRLNEAQTGEEVERLNSEYWAKAAPLEDDYNFRLTYNLLNEAKDRHIPINNLEWEGDLSSGGHLDQKSLSRLFQAVREDKRTNRAQLIQMLTALTGIIGVLIGLVAIFKK
jgi:hypothetical protein